jgi:hypothetical protein
VQLYLPYRPVGEMFVEADYHLLEHLDSLQDCPALDCSFFNIYKEEQIRANIYTAPVEYSLVNLEK